MQYRLFVWIVSKKENLFSEIMYIDPQVEEGKPRFVSARIGYSESYTRRKFVPPSIIFIVTSAGQSVLPLSAAP